MTASRWPISLPTPPSTTRRTARDNRDGSDTNHSWNHGVEGPTDDAAIVAARQRDVKSILATLMVARGTPMLSMGDELGRTQRGNNNAYAQDNALAWVDWDHADDMLIDFVAALCALAPRASGAARRPLADRRAGRRVGHSRRRMALPGRPRDDGRRLDPARPSGAGRRVLRRGNGRQRRRPRRRRAQCG